jgi:hypothetical protein
MRRSSRLDGKRELRLARVFRSYALREEFEIGGRPPSAGLLKAGILGGQPCQCRPVEIGFAAGYTGDEVIAQEARNRHWDVLRICCSQHSSHVLESERHCEPSRAKSVLEDEFAVGLVYGGGEEAARQDPKKLRRVDARFADQRDGLARHSMTEATRKFPLSFTKLAFGGN